MKIVVSIFIAMWMDLSPEVNIRSCKRNLIFSVKKHDLKHKNKQDNEHSLKENSEIYKEIKKVLSLVKEESSFDKKG